MAPEIQVLENYNALFLKLIVWSVKHPNTGQNIEQWPYQPSPTPTPTTRVFVAKILPPPPPVEFLLQNVVTQILAVCFRDVLRS